MKRTVVSIVGARPQFVKAAVVSPALRLKGMREVLVHTGQHYDWAMSESFFEGLEIPSPDVNLRVGSGSHGRQTGRMLESIEAVLLAEKPAMVILFGDTNSTLSGALAAAKLNLPVAHIEAGLRSFDRNMPEEINRVVTDHLATLLFAPTSAAVANLAAEGIIQGVRKTGDVMYDVVMKYRERIVAIAKDLCKEFSVQERRFALMTVHRAENTTNEDRWWEILDAASEIAKQLPILWPVHPRTREQLRGLRWQGVSLMDPLPYLQTQALVRSARVVLTDSGGIQKECAWHETPCVTLREQTEWTELTECGVNVLAGADCKRIVAAVENAEWPRNGLPEGMYGDGRSAEAIAESVRETIEAR